MKVAITGGRGFLGWHTACRLRSRRGIEPVLVARPVFSAPTLVDIVADTDVILHLAGVNRASSDEIVEAENVELASILGDAIKQAGRPVHVVNANSVQSLLDNAYGRGKARAAAVLSAAVDAVDGSLTDVLLPNLFGEHGRPHYNSFVATFCHELARGGTPRVTGDREIGLLHAQAAAEMLICAAEDRATGTVQTEAEYHRVSEVLARLERFKACYDRGEVPALTDRFSIDLFNTYRSYTFPDAFPFVPPVHSDARGDLFEVVRSHGGTGQMFVSTTVPGATRGDHYHLRKVERFFVVKGEAEIALRRLYDEEVVRFRLSGDRPSFVDMPTMWAHNVKNVGTEELVTVFWSDQLLDPDDPDQFPERVELEVTAP